MLKITNTNTRFKFQIYKEMLMLVPTSSKKHPSHYVNKQYILPLKLISTIDIFTKKIIKNQQNQLSSKFKELLLLLVIFNYAYNQGWTGHITRQKSHGVNYPSIISVEKPCRRWWSCLLWSHLFCHQVWWQSYTLLQLYKT
jgi:hypothetical protein